MDFIPPPGISTHNILYYNYLHLYAPLFQLRFHLRDELVLGLPSCYTLNVGLPEHVDLAFAALGTPVSHLCADVLLDRVFSGLILIALYLVLQPRPC